MHDGTPAHPQPQVPARNSWANDRAPIKDYLFSSGKLFTAVRSDWGPHGLIKASDIGRSCTAASCAAPVT